MFYKKISTKNFLFRVACVASIIFFINVLLIEVIQPKLSFDKYDMSQVEGKILDEPVPQYAEKLKIDQKTGGINFNQGYTATKDVAGQSAAPKITAEFSPSPDGSVKVNDPINRVSVTLKPTFKVDQPKKLDNRVIYPMSRKNVTTVFTTKGTGIKEDIIINKYQGEKLDLEYDLSLSDGLKANIENDGSLAVYGADPTLLGEVSTGSEKDANLLKKARDNAEKTKLIFRIPAPFIVEASKKSSQAKAWFTLDNNKLSVHATNLDKATYPLSIDPSVYVDSATRLMRGNNETNLDFDVSNELIQKGSVTGARIPSWTSTSALTSARWNHATAVMGGYVYAVGGSSGSTNVANVYWSKFNTSTKALESPNPGAGACTNWCNNSAYDLPSARAGASMVAYNGFLYVFGGFNATPARTNTVYIAKIGVNGEPSLWHPTDTNPNNWVYWYPSTNTLSTERTYSTAVAANNRVYLMGGQTNAATGGVTTVEYADLKPTGDIGSWSTSGMVVLPSARFGHSSNFYNDRIYLVGGNSSGTLQNTVHYMKINSDGSFAGATWTSTTPFTTARMAWGGNMTTIWGGYLYLAGGCSAVNGSGYCTTIASDMQIASLNADGSLTDWSDIIGLTNTRMGYGLVSWRNAIYGIGGCSVHNTSTGACTTTLTTTNYGVINNPGDVSTVNQSVASGTAPCSGGAPLNCDIPVVGDNAGQGGRMANGVVVNNGYIYIIGGCTNVAAGNTCESGGSSRSSGNISFAALAADGSIVRAGTCGGTFAGTWCVDSTNRINGTAGLSAFAATVFNNTIYVYGGTDGSTWRGGVYRVGLNTNGSLTGAWTEQTATNLALGTERGYSFMFTRANPGSAGTYPGNLYILGGCRGTANTTDGLGCSNYYTEVYKCNITTTGALEEANANDCDTAGQLQIDSESGGGSEGLGLMSGTVYANYVYLIAGSSDNFAQRQNVIYARIDNSNNIVAISGGAWTISGNVINPARRRGYSFGNNGYLYTIAGHDGSVPATLNDLLYSKINVSDGSFDTFTTSSVTVVTSWDFKAIVANGYVYAFGGCTTGNPPGDCTAMAGTVQTFQLYNNYSGTPAAYSASANLFTTDRIGASSTVLNGYIYVAGGCTSATDCTDATNNVQYAPLNADGSIGTWANTTATLPADRTWGQLETSGGSLYYIGGQSDTATDERAEVYYATPSSGNISTWGTATNALPVGRTHHSAAVWNNRIYVTGGLDTSAAAQTTVYYSPTLASGGDIGSAWSTATGFSVARSGQTAIAYANNLYILGGYTGSQYLNDVQYTQINSDGTLDSWTYTTSLPRRVRNADGYAANGYMYLFGGRSADTTCTTNTYVAGIAANTTIASGNDPTGVGEWSETNVKFPGADRYGAAAAFDQGRAYVMGGGCGATLTYTGANRIVQSVMQSQPMVAKYSRMIDTDTDIFPTKWLMNGLDNSIGARWNMRYRSSTAGTASWGQDTNFGTVTLGQPEVYIPKDSGGTNTNFSRYHFMMVTIDSSQAFGYPEDVSRGPTIADLSLFFTSDPSKRLRHGKTFTGGEQQPLDTPF